MDQSDIDALPKTACVYALLNNTNGKRYVGSAARLRKRIYEHHRRLEKGNHGNPHLQAAWKAVGATAWTVEILEQVAGATDLELLPVETRWIKHFGAVKSGYNICPAGGTRRGAKMSPESCARAGAAKRGNTYRRGSTVPVTTRLAIAAKLLGGKATPETLAKLSAFQKGRPKPPSFAEKMSVIHKGRIISPEHRAKISMTMTGRKLPQEVTDKRIKTLAAKVLAGWHRPPMTDENKAKVSAVHKGKILSAETKAKMSAARKGKPHNLTAQQRQLVAEKMRKTWDQRRAEGRIGRGGHKKPEATDGS